LSVSAVVRSRGVSQATVHRSILMAKVRETKPDRRRPDQRDDVRRRPTTCAVWWWASPEDTRLPEARVAWKLNNRSHALQDPGEIRERLAADGRGGAGGEGRAVESEAPESRISAKNKAQFDLAVDVAKVA
jgi:hypothetical protein